MKRFLTILSIETNLTTSVDSLAVKTTQSAVSNFVPVVGKFFSDSFESVVGASKIISNVGGTLGIIAIIVVAEETNSAMSSAVPIASKVMKAVKTKYTK